MNTDIRIAVNFWDHPKTAKLERRLGLEAVKALTKLWMWAALNRPDGDLGDMDDEDIAIAAAWSGGDHEFVQTLVSLRWLDGQPGEYSLHDWHDHNQWAAEAESRSDAARFLRLAKTDKKEYERLKELGTIGLSKKDYAKITARLCTVQRDVDAPYNGGSAERPRPAPAPAPKPEEEEEEEKTPPYPPEGGEWVSPAAERPVPVPGPAEAERPSSAPRPADTSEASPRPRPPASEGTKQSPASDFEAFWAQYPRKKSKGQAIKTWEKLRKAGILPELSVIAAKIQALARSPDWVKDSGQFIPYPATWLNAHGWLDEPDQAIIRVEPARRMTPAELKEKNIAALQAWRPPTTEGNYGVD